MIFNRIALIFDDQLRPDTTGGYCLSALRQLSQVEHLHPSQLQTVRRGSFDLFLSVDDGLDYALPPHLRPSALWAIDTHLDPGRIVRRARSVDVVLAAQRDGMELLQREGANCIGWLPLACDPSVHRAHTLPKGHDVSFVGHINCPERAQLLTALLARYPNTFVGQLFFDEMARKYSQSRIVFNRSIRNDVNMRVFEVLSCGSFLLTNELPGNGLPELFTDGVHLVTYRTEDDLLDKVAYYLENDEERERIAAAGREEVVARHTYSHRMAELLRQIGNNLRVRGTARTGSQSAITGDRRALEWSESAATSQADLTSIIVVTHNQLEYTKSCLQSVRDRTDAAYELILVDNASTDGTIEYLRSQKDVQLIENDQNRGFPAAANQGIAVAKGQQLLLLNNDTVVTAGWLGRLLRMLQDHPRVALVGPCSNCVSGPQQIPVEYADLSGLEEFADRWAHRHAQEARLVGRLVGFCLLVRRALVDEIGLLDERFGIGNFEDDDYCCRALRAGYQAAIALDCFVHHFGSRTFLGSGVDLAEVLQRNGQLFHEKWAHESSTLSASCCPKRSSHAEPVVVAPSAMAPDPAVQELRLSLCMIVRNSVSTLGACLRSIRPWVDEMVIVDTGSTDDTVQLAAGLGARVFHYPWSDSFSAARNESLRHARGQWIFWMDSDDTIDETNGRKLRELSSRDPGPSVLGYVMQVYCPGTVASESRGADVTAVDHVKLLRNLPHLRFEGRIHEQVLPAIRAAGGDVLWTDVHVVHSGSDQSPKGRQRKWERDLRLLELDLRDRPDHTFVLFNLGMTYADAGEHGKAVEAFCKSLAAAHPQESHVRKAYALLCASQCALGQHQEARVACQSGLRLYPDDLELRFLQGNLAFREGRLDEAQAAYLAVLSGTTPRYFASIDRGIAGFKARHNLAAVYQEMGLPHQAESQWLQVLAEAPRYPPACRGLGQLLLQQNRLNELDDFAERLEDEDTDLVGLRLLLQGLAAEARGDIGDARHKLQEAFEAEPHDLTICDARCRFLFENGGPEEAEGALVDLAAKDPANGSVHHNLGAIYARVGRHADAIRAYRHSLHLRPDAAATRALLNEVLSRLNPQADNGRDRASEILASAD